MREDLIVFIWVSLEHVVGTLHGVFSAMRHKTPKGSRTAKSDIIRNTEFLLAPQRDIVFGHKPSPYRETFVISTDRIDPADSMEPGDGEQNERSRFGGYTMGDREIRLRMLPGR